ncbi:SIR2 family protein [Paenibacillus chitinolyticus]
MKINWPENLIEEIAYRRCVLFLGAGISATARNDGGESPKRWGEFVTEAMSLLNEPDQHKMDLKQNFIRKMVGKEDYLMALQTIFDSSDPGRYANFLRQAFSRPNFRASTVHQLIKEIDSKLVITTNFEKIYENLCNDHGYTIANYSEVNKIITNLKTTENLIIKAHGTIEDVDGMVFTLKQYFEAKKTHPEFYQILKALFLTNTVIFLGYSLNDPDINLVLETLANSSSSSSPHYIVVKQGLDEEVKQYWKDCYNIYPLEYGPEYENLEENIESLRDRVLDYRAAKRMP